MLIKRKKFEMTSKVMSLPNGNKVRLDMIIHPGAALIVPFLSADRVIMLRQWRPVLNQYLLELPAGTIDPGESVLSCVKRELTEETGYRARSITRLGKIHPVPGYSNEVIYIYKAEGLVFADGQAEPDEVLERKVVSKSEVRTLFRSGRITDGKTISALAMCGWL